MQSRETRSGKGCDLKIKLWPHCKFRRKISSFLLTLRWSRHKWSIRPLSEEMPLFGENAPLQWSHKALSSREGSRDASADPLGCPDTSSPRLLQERCGCSGVSSLCIGPCHMDSAASTYFLFVILRGNVVHWWEAAKNEQAKSAWTCNVFQLWPLISLAATVVRLLLSETSSLMSILRHGLEGLGQIFTGD